MEPARDYLTEGEARLDAGDYAAALEAFGHAILHDPQNGRAWYGRGRALAALERLNDAIPALEMAVKFESTNVDWFLTLAQARRARGDVEAYLQRHREIRRRVGKTGITLDEILEWRKEGRSE